MNKVRFLIYKPEHDIWKGCFKKGSVYKTYSPKGQKYIHVISDDGNPKIIDAREFDDVSNLIKRSKRIRFLTFAIYMLIGILITLIVKLWFLTR